MGGEDIVDPTHAVAKSDQAATSDVRWWQALITRDRGADGAFVYAVLTTGVFCRPGCPSRLPKRDNVVFFATAREAAQAGFRPCKRCRPEAAVSPYAADAALIETVCGQIAQAEEMPLVQDLAQSAGLSVFHFQRVFKAVTGITPKQYMMAHRAERFRDGLRRSQSVTEAIYDAGFGSSSRAYAGSAGALGMPPGAYRRGAADIEIWWTAATCALGWVLVAATARGICSIAFADTPEALRAELGERYPRAHIREAGPEFQAWLDAVLSLIKTPERGFDLPLDIQGTAFQQRVWQALRDVPAGDTISYAELAQQIGAPHGARAVGRACASNPIAVAVPCHRAVRSNGTPAGYRWGISRKIELLEQERVAAARKRRDVRNLTSDLVERD